MIVAFNNKTVKVKTRSSKFTVVKMVDSLTKFNVRVLSDDESMGLAHGSGSYKEGAEVEIWAEAKAGYKFTRWSDGSTEARRTITVNEDIELTAYFEEDMSRGTLTYIPHKVYFNIEDLNN